MRMLQLILQIILMLVAFLIYRFYERYFDSTTCCLVGTSGTDVDVDVDIDIGIDIDIDATTTDYCDPSIHLKLKFQYPANSETNHINYSSSTVHIEFNENDNNDIDTDDDIANNNGFRNRSSNSMNNGIESDHFYYDFNNTTRTTTTTKDNNEYNNNHNKSTKYKYYYEYKYQYEYKNPCKFFSVEYVEARDKFRTAVNQYKNRNSNNNDNTELLSFPIVVVDNDNDDDGDDDEKKKKSNNNETTATTVFTIDVAIIHGNTKELGTIIHSSGVHGVEGYAGSAIQLAILEILTETSTSNNNDNTIYQEQRMIERPTIIMFHAVNPVGMSEYRRCNENNVDLNRNCIILKDPTNNDSEHGAEVSSFLPSYSSFEEFLVQRDPNIAGYDDFRLFFAPETNDEKNKKNENEIENIDNGNNSTGSISSGDHYYDNDTNTSTNTVGLSFYDNTIGYYIKAIPALLKYGMAAIKKAMVTGQYHHQSGLNFGGQQRQQSLHYLIQFFTTTATTTSSPMSENDTDTIRTNPQDLFDSSPSVIWIDVHTGLGPFGKDSIEYHYVHEEEEQQPHPHPKDFLSATSYSFTPTNNGNSHSESNNDMMGEGDGDAFAGYDLSEGRIMDYFADSYRRQVTTTTCSSSKSTSSTCDSDSRSGIFMVQEFGTLPPVLVGRALVLDNMLYQQYLVTSKKNQKKETHKQKQRNNNNNDNDTSKKEEEGHRSWSNKKQSYYRSPYLRQAFYPQSMEWRKSILERGVALFLQSIEYNKAQSYSYSQSQSPSS